MSAALTIRTEALSQASGLPLAAYREAHLAERVRRALEREHLENEAELAHRLAADPTARARFRRSVAISVSGMFRDPAQFDLLRAAVLPGLVARSGRIRVWSAGCADGSELYTVALLLGRLRALGRSLLLGSDVLGENLVLARQGRYAGFAAPRQLRSAVRWELRDLTAGVAPHGRWDLVLCRNVGIYFGNEARERLHRTLAGAVAPGGALLLGRSERLSDERSLGLEPAGRNLYRRPA